MLARPRGDIPRGRGAPRLPPDAIRSRRDQHLHHTVAPLPEQFVRLDDPVERKVVREQWGEIQASMTDKFHEPSHTLLASGAERGGDRVVCEPGTEGLVGHRELAGVYAKTRQHA